MPRKPIGPPKRVRVRVGEKVTLYVAHGAAAFPPGSEVDVPAEHVDDLVTAGHVETIPTSSPMPPTSSPEVPTSSPSPASPPVPAR